MQLIDCKERVEAYVRNMGKHGDGGDAALHVRFLDKIFKAAMDPYTEQERRWVVQRLLDVREATPEYAALNMLYAWKINRILGLGMNVPAVRLDEALELVNYKYVPPEILKSLQERGNTHTVAFVDSVAPDYEAIANFNIYISHDHFFHREVVSK